MTSDKGTELTSMVILHCSEERRVDRLYIVPGKPQQSAFVEDAARGDEMLVSTLPQARAVLAAWQDDNNRTRPRSALYNATPAEFVELSRLAEEAA
ncbi:MAG: integrase core domain-containing protein [Pseudomonadota bacterium]